MKIAIVTTEFVVDETYAGGLANYTYRIAKSLQGLGHSVTVVYLQRKNDLKFEEHDGIGLLYVMPKPIMGHLTTRIFNKLLQYAGKLFPKAKIQVEIATRLAAASNGVRAAMKYHVMLKGVDIVHYTHLEGLGAFHDRSRASLVRLSSYRDLWLPYGFPFSSPAERLFEDLALRRCDRIVAPSSFVANYVQARFKKVVGVVSSPFLPDQNYKIFANTKNRPAAAVAFSRPYGIYFGSICSWKGIGVLVEALKRFLAEADNYQFVFIGRPLGLINGVEPHGLIRDVLGCFSGRVHVINSLRHEQLYPYVEEAEFAAFPTLADNFPNVILEAMYLKKCIISTFGRGVDEQIDHEHNGLLVPPNDPELLSQMMLRVARMSSRERWEYGIRAHETLARFSPEFCAKELVVKYEDAIALHRFRKRPRVRLEKKPSMMR
jgi:glycosyltransferase involved in cell wall biosynthesis